MTEIAHVCIDSLFYKGQEKPALKDIDLKINERDFIVITGSAASGKTSLLNCISGAVPKYFPAELNGTVKIYGSEVSSLADNAGILGYMIQEPQSCIVCDTVRDDVAFGPGNLCLDRDEINLRISSSLKSAGVENLALRRVTELSGGEAQRVVLAGVLAMGVKFLLLDQPTAELDPKGRREVYAALGDLNKNGMTVCMVMDSQDALPYATRILEMEKGTIVREFPPSLYVSPHRKIKNISHHHGEIIAEMKNVAYQYKNGIIGCKNTNLTVMQGELIAVTGENGSGKSTLAKLLGFLIFPSEGEIYLFGKKADKRNKDLRNKIGFLFQNPDRQIFKDTLEEETAFNLKIQGIPEEEISSRTEVSLRKLGLYELRKTHPQKLSRGQRQLLALAGIFAGNYQLIIADEPTSGLDEGQSTIILDELQNLNADGRTVIFITHDMELAESYAERIISMRDGRIIRG